MIVILFKDRSKSNSYCYYLIYNQYLQFSSHSCMDSSALIELIQSINDRDLSQREITKKLAKSADKPFYPLLSKLVNTAIDNKQKIDNYDKVKQDNARKQQTIRDLKTKIVELKDNKFQKTKQFSQHIQRKVNILQLLEAGNFQRVIELCKTDQNAKIEYLARQLLEYKWFKRQVQDMELHIPHKERPFQWSIKGKKLKDLLETNKIYRIRANDYLQQALTTLLDKQWFNQLNLPKQYFRQACRDSFAKIGLRLEVLKQVKKADEQNNIAVLLKAAQQLGIPLRNQSKKYFGELFDQFLQKLKNLLPEQDLQMVSPLVRTQSQQPRQQVEQQSANFSVLFEQIKKILRIQNTSLQDLVSPNLSPRDSILSCFKNISAKMNGMEECMVANREIVENYMNAQSTTLQRLAILNQGIEERLQSIQKISRIQFSKITYDNNISLFQKNFYRLLQELDRKSVPRTSVDSSQDKNLQNLRKKAAKTNEADIYSTNSNSQLLQETIQKLKKEIEELKEVNKQLANKYDYYKQSLEQEYKLNDMHRKHKQTLVSRLKLLEGVQSSILNAPIIDQSSNIPELQQKFAAINIENTHLKNKIEEKEFQLKNYDLLKSELIEKLEKQKGDQIKKWKAKYEDSRSEVEDLYRQVLNLNTILQEKMFDKNYSLKESINLYAKTIFKQSIALEQKEKPEKKSIQIQYSDVFSEVYTEGTSLQNEARPQQIQLQIAQCKQKIEQMQNIISQLSQQKIEKQKNYLQAILREKKRFQELFEQSRRQRSQLQSKITEFSQKMVTHSAQNIKNLHLFALGSIFEESDYKQRLFLIQNLTSYLGPIKRTRLLYRADNYNKVNFHRYIDKEKHIVMIAKTLFGRLVAGYSQEAFDTNGTKRGYGMLLSLWAGKMFPIKEKKAVSYDDYFVIFGNSELRIKSLEFRLFSNFGIANGYFDNRGEKVHSILGEDKERQVDISQYEFYALDLEYS